MKETKRRLETFSFYDRTGLEAHLARMAAEGWMVEKIGQFFWYYRKIEPKTLTFSVTYFPKASQFDPEPSEEQRTFYDFCEHSGWVLAAANAQLQVFCNERPNPVPIETDPVLEVESIHHTMKKSLIPSQLGLLVVAFLNAGLTIWRLSGDPIGVLSSPAYLFTSLCWMLLFLLIGVELSSYFRWHRRAVLAAERGEFVSTGSHRKLQIGALVFLAVITAVYMLSIAASGSRMMIAMVLIMFFVYVPGLFLLIWGVKSWLKRKKVAAKISRVVTVVSALAAAYLFVGVIVFGTLFGSSHGWLKEKDEETYRYNGVTFTARHDELPLTLEELVPVEFEGYDRELHAYRSPLLEKYDAMQRPRFDAEHYKEMPDLEYTVTVVKAPFLYGLCEKSLRQDREERWNRDMPESEWYSYEPTDPAPWGAEAAYCWTSREYGPRNTFLLCYPDRFVEIEFDHQWEVTPEQMALVGERLGHGLL